MSHKWKFILTNWINCYFNEGSKKENSVNLESLLSIISHLRENLNLDESKSSILEAHTVEEFVHEKYPQFKFENGTVEATNEEELYIVASLLLFFVCVNSKDVDIRNAMCSKLGSEDQETIMKFSKALMECSPITCSDVQAAITEACGQDIAAVESITGPKMVAETPPALRSLHGEVRRLQAALEAERFDRNYLQDELARTNLKLEKLLKDKEQYKLDIVNLKAKISMCCGQEAEVQGGDAASESSSRLTRQLEDLEERLVVTQEQLDDALLERDTYKAKVEQLKQERDKWLSVSQTEASRAAQLTQELETERHHVQSLQDLVTELRQHNLKNCLDASQLECDDPDASIHSLHNASVCSEACANVIEVQLSEERAKVVILKQKIQELQDQLVDLNQRTENETQSLRSIITENDNNIFNLKHRINEEIEEKNIIKAHFSEEMDKLNNEITELEQKLKHNSESSRQVIEQKMQEIQNLQEEKLSLLQSLSDETTKLESIIKDLRTDINTEKNLKLKMKEDYENKMMRLNEKVLNRNNELVELQNNIFEKSELIEQLYQNLRTEKETKEELSNKCNDNISQLNERNDTVERNFQQKCEEAKELQKRLQQNGVVFSELNKEIDDLKAINSDLSEKCRILEDTKATLLNDLQHHAYKVEEIQKEMTNIHQLFSEEKEELEQNFYERNATIDTLKQQLHDEIQYKTGIQNELAILQQARTNLSEQVNKLNTEMTTLKSDVLDKDRMIYTLDLYLKEEKHTNKNLKQDCDMMDEDIKKMSEQITKKDNEIIEVNNKLESESKCFQEVLHEKEDLIKSINNQLSSEIAEKNALITTLNSLNEEKDRLVQDFSQKCNENTLLKENNEKLTQFADKNNMIIETLEKKMEVEVKKYAELENTLKEQTSELMSRINEYEKIILETNTQFTNTINEKALQIKNHELELESLNEINKSLKAMQDTLVNDKNILLVEKETLTKTLHQEKAARDEIETEKEDALIQFKQLNEKYACDMNDNQEELRNTRDELNHLKTDFKKYEEDNIKMASVLNNGIERILQNMAKEEICIEVLQKLFAGKIEDIPFNEKLDVLINIADTLTTEFSLSLKNSNIRQITEERYTTEILKLKDDLETEVKSLQDVIQECKFELSQQTETYNNLTESNVKHIKKLELENESLINELNDVKVKLEEKVHSLKEKLLDNEIVTEKLKQTYECQIDNLNLMINKLTSYLKDKTLELEEMRKEKERLLNVCEDNKKTIKSLEEEKKSEKQDREKIITDFESERLVLRNMVTVTESVMEDQKVSLNKAISEHVKANEKLHEDIKALQQLLQDERKYTESKIHEKETAFNSVFKELTALRSEKESLEKEAETQNELYHNEITALKMEIMDKVTYLETIKSQNKDLINEKLWLEKEITTLREELDTKSSCVETLKTQNIDFTNALRKLREDTTTLEQKYNELKIQKDSLEFELLTDIDNLTKSLKGEMVKSDNIICSTLHERLQTNVEIHAKFKILTDKIMALVKEKNDQITKLVELKTKLDTNELTCNEEITKLKQENFDLRNILKENQIVITNQQQLIQHELEQNEKLREDTTMDKVDMQNKLTVLQECQHTAERQIEEYKTQISSLQNNIDSLKLQLTEEIETLNTKINGYENDLKEKDAIISKISEESDKLCKTIVQVKGKGEKCQKELELKISNLVDEATKLEQENIDLLNQIKENQSVIIILDEMIKRVKDENEKLREDTEAYERELKEKDEILFKKTEEIDTIRKSLDDEKEISNTMRKSLNEEKETSEKYQKEIGSKFTTLNEEIAKLKDEKACLLNMVKENETVLTTLEEVNNHVQGQNKKLREDTSSYEKDLKEKDNIISKMTEQIETIHKALDEEKEIRGNYQKELESKCKTLIEETATFKKEKADLLNEKKENETRLTNEKQLLKNELEQTEKLREKTAAEKIELENKLFHLKERQNNIERQFTADFEALKTNLNRYEEDLKAKDIVLAETIKEKQVLSEALDEAKGISEKYHRELKSTIATLNDELAKLKQENIELLIKVTDNQTVITNYEQSVKYELEQSEKLREVTAAEKQQLKDRCSILEEYQTKAEKDLEDHKSELSSLKITINCVKSQLSEQIETLNTKVISYEQDLKEKDVIISEIIEEKEKLNAILVEEKEKAEKYQNDLESNVATLNVELAKVKQENNELLNKMTDDKTVRSNQELNTAAEKLNLTNKCSLLEEYQIKAEKQLEEYKTEVTSLKLNIDNIKSQFTDQIEALKTKLVSYDHELKERDIIVCKVAEEKEALCKALDEAKDVSEKYHKELESKAATVYELRQKLEEVKKEAQVLEVMRKENDNMMFAVGQLETFAMVNQEKSSSNKYIWQTERHQRDHHQVSTPTSDLTHSSMESFKTISDLEKIIHDKNRTITTLQSDITYLKSLTADSENKLLDVNKELEVTQDICQQLSTQLKKTVQQKNEEIADLKKQVTKMCVTENRASQIIKVSAKYQAIILKRIAEIKSNTILKEMTNFGNNANSENEPINIKRNLSSAITMEDLENFLETTDRHLKRCSEKQLALQKDRDRLTEVNRINESEIINLKKFLTELSVSFKTFYSIKDLYAQKLSKVVSVQRTVRREILNLDGRITDTMMCKLERGYAAVMQDLSECAMNLERWVERCIGRTISSEKIKQAFSSESDRTSLASISFQNTALEVQLEELENSFQKLLEEVVRAQKGEGAKDAQSVTVMEVRAEYEDKLNRMKAKMKQLYQEQIAIFKDKQKDEVAALERELHKAREKLAESSRAYEEHIRSLTTELWSVGEKFLVKKEEAEWLRRKQRSGSLMSLQHVHSSGLVPPPEEPSRPSDTYSLRSLPVNTNNTIKEKREGREGRGLHMSDEEGEVFDNRWLQELSATPRRESVAPAAAPGQRLSELRWRNSLCPPHLKSSYPAETQFTAALDEEDIKCVAASNVGKQQRKEVGITAYKKPGPPTPSKQAGRLSATGSELRESLRVEAEPHASRKTSTPSRLRSLFRSAKNDTTEGTPRSRRLSNIFRKK